MHAFLFKYSIGQRAFSSGLEYVVRKNMDVTMQVVTFPDSSVLHCFKSKYWKKIFALSLTDFFFIVNVAVYL